MPVRMTPKQLRQAGLRSNLIAIKSEESKNKTHKYNNIKVEKDGYTFDSKKEMRRYCQLKLMQEHGIIQNLQLQVEFVLAESVKFQNESKAKPALRYIADFVYVKNGNKVVEDVKSKVTRTNDVYRIKKHLMMSEHGIEIMEV